MTERQRATAPANAARIAFAGLIIAGGALAMASQAGADPAVPSPTPVPGQPVVANADGPVGPPPPPPVGPPPVPEIANPVYGSGQYGSGPLSGLRDIWHQARDPYGVLGSPDGMPVGSPPPPGAGPPPPLPPGYVSLNAPGSETPSSPTGPAQGGPPLPPGYYPLNGPPPPGYGPPTGPDPAAPPTVAPVPPTP
jgi:hypothetical protein